MIYKTSLAFLILLNFSNKREFVFSPPERSLEMGEEVILYGN